MIRFPQYHLLHLKTKLVAIIAHQQVERQDDTYYVRNQVNNIDRAGFTDRMGEKHHRPSDNIHTLEEDTKGEHGEVAPPEDDTE
jgi:hypothetical protein